ncbi:TniB family NTP-binding protein [Marinimicrobium sp. C2-29]|uniref:TniB family NTP-binding protein n=1 Tax=Marinimicrobium sp. C2-29 TaxID=3139825 RepID=UPI00313866B6
MKIDTYSHIPFDLAGDTAARHRNNGLPESAQKFYAATMHHKIFKQGMEALEATHSMSGLEGGGMIVEGDPGLGKTTLLNTYVSRVYKRPSAQPTEELTPLPVLIIRIPGRPTIPRVIEKLLEVGEHIKPYARSSGTLDMRLNRMIVEQRVEMIVFDEYHHLLKRDRYTGDTLNFMKILCDEHRLATVCSGLLDGRDVLDGHPELRERLSFDHVLFQPFDMTTRASAIEFGQYMRGIAKALDEAGVNCCPINDKDMLLRILLATQGKPRFINKLFMRLILRLKDGRPITRTFMEQMYPDVPFNAHLGNFNPFSASYDKVEARYEDYLKSLEDEAKRLKGKTRG